jgi:hypothetical protein
LIPDSDTDDAINGSSSGDDAIPTTGFVAAMWKDGEDIGDLAVLEAAPYNLTIDNVSIAGALAGYKVNITLPDRAMWTLWMRHPTSMLAFRQASFDLVTRAEVLSTIQGNTRTTFNFSELGVPARKVGPGVLDTMTVEQRYDGATDFTAPNLVSSLTLNFVYDVVGQTNPILVAPA